MPNVFPKNPFGSNPNSPFPVKWLVMVLIVCAAVLVFLWDPQSDLETTEQYKALPIEELQEYAQEAEPKAWIALAECYLEGQKLPLDSQQAIQYLQKAALQGDSEAQYKLGMLLFDGFRPTSQARVLQSAQPPADGSAYSSSQQRVPMSRNEAVPLIEQSAVQGYAPAFKQMGMILEKGIVKDRNLSEAFKWYLKAAEAGDSDAQYTVAEMYQEGQGTRNSNELALQWYTASAEQGNVDALYSLGYAYERGRFVDKDMDKALEFYGQSCDNGLQKGCNKYRRLNQSMHNR